MLSTKDQEVGLTLHTCEICGQDELTESDMRTHLLLEHIEGSISCPFCDLADVTIEEMSCHIEAQHSDHFGASSAKTADSLKRGVNVLQTRTDVLKENENPNCKVCINEEKVP